MIRSNGITVTGNGLKAPTVEVLRLAGADGSKALIDVRDSSSPNAWVQIVITPDALRAMLEAFAPKE